MKNKIFKIIMVLSVLLICLIGISSNEVQASPAMSTTTEFKQPSGQTFLGQANGDEYLHWVKSDTGYILVKDPSGYWNFGINQNGKLVSSGSKYLINSKPTGALTSVTKEMIQNSKPVVNSSTIATRSTSLHPSQDYKMNFIGDKKVLVLLVEFADSKLMYSESQWNTKFFGDGKNSVRDYYKEVSFNKCLLSPASETAGTANDGVIKVSLNSNYSTFNNHVAILDKALTEANKNIDFAQYDKNGDGCIENDELIICTVFGVYEDAYSVPFESGEKSTWGNVIDMVYDWQNVGITLDGKAIGAGNGVTGISTQGERHGNASSYHMATIGVLAHEIGHIMGLPDLYIEDPQQYKTTVGMYSLMSAGSWGKSENGYSGDRPTHLDAWSKVKLGFVKPTEVYTSSEFSPVRSFTCGEVNSVRKIYIPSHPDEYFLVENRQKVGYDRSIWNETNGGILIWHVKQIKVYIAGVEVSYPDAVNVESCSLKEPSTFSTQTKSRFNQTSSPNSNLYDGSPSHIAITTLSESGPTMWIKENLWTQIDTQVPSKPLNLRTVENGTNYVKFAWDGSWDNSCIQAYEIYRNDKLISVNAGTNYTDTQVQTGVEYKYRVVAIDIADNASEKSQVLVKKIGETTRTAKIYYKSASGRNSIACIVGANFIAPSTGQYTTTQFALMKDSTVYPGYKEITINMQNFAAVNSFFSINGTSNFDTNIGGSCYSINEGRWLINGDTQQITAADL